MNKKIDPICGMSVNIETAVKNNLTSEKDKEKHYFCSSSCKSKFDHKREPWYKTEIFSKAFPWFLATILILGTVLSITFDFMIIYMGIFFILFSLMKMVDWPGFVKAFSMYDVLAKRSRFYGWAYPGIEFIIGILYLFDFFILGVAWVTLIIMGIGIVGVTKNLLSPNKVQCACLGTKINVPLTKVTFLENLLMIIMAAMLISFGKI